MVQELPWNLICSGRSDPFKYGWSPKLLNKSSPKCRTKSISKLFQHDTLRNFAKQNANRALEE